MSRLSFVLKYTSIFISIDIFDVLCMISRVQVYVLETVQDLHDLDISSGFIKGAGISYSLVTYGVLQYYPIVHL